MEKRKSAHARQGRLFEFQILNQVMFARTSRDRIFEKDKDSNEPYLRRPRNAKRREACSQADEKRDLRRATPSPVRATLTFAARLAGAGRLQQLRRSCRGAGVEAGVLLSCVRREGVIQMPAKSGLGAINF